MVCKKLNVSGLEPGGGFDMDKVKTARARTADPAQPPRRPTAGRDTALADEIGMSGTAYEIFNRARAASALTVARERQLNLKKRQGLFQPSLGTIPP